MRVTVGKMVMLKTSKMIREFLKRKRVIVGSQWAHKTLASRVHVPCPINYLLNHLFYWIIPAVAHESRLFKT